MNDGSIIARRQVRTACEIMAARHRAGAIRPSAGASIFKYFAVQVERLAASSRITGQARSALG
jgi:hypothetical protein